MRLKALIRIMNYVTTQANAYTYTKAKDDKYVWLLMLGKQVIHVLSRKKIKGENVDKHFFQYANNKDRFRKADWYYKAEW